MSLQEWRFLVRADLYRHVGTLTPKKVIWAFLVIPGFKYMFWIRTCVYLANHGVLRFGVFHFARLILEHYRYKYGIEIPYATTIGPGLFMGHVGGIIVNGQSVIGRNCNISNDVTLGQANRGPRQGYPILGDQVYLGPGVKIVGHVRIGNNVAIGANCVVTHDVPDNAVVVGIPGKVISYNGSKGYIDNVDYE